MTGLDDRRYMAAAIRLARRHEGWTGTNPSVSCVIVAQERGGPVIVGTGITAVGGRPHAEPLAVAEAGERARGATAYVTLEPCAHHGSTPPCAQSLIDAGISRVVTAVIDPDERVNQLGHAMLRDAGLEVETDICAEEAGLDIAAYLKHKKYRKPYVTLKLAVSADGALGVKGQSRTPITGPVALARGHMMRARHSAILVGSGTVREDDPELTCRLPGLEHHSPARIVLDSGGHLSGREKIADARKVRTYVVSPGDRAASAELVAGGCVMLACELESGKVALPELLDDLGSIGMMSLMVEGGAAVASSFLAGGLVDEIALFTSPVEIGSADHAVCSPVTPDTIPVGFFAVEEAVLGADRLVRYAKAH